ncbi:hypothetical protein HYN69_18190 (plasmid) [Gemmobacter aquarius]|uniref:Uncharacterized protein n=1 Tax=Paragemmobacter aquarius TaxID=2169400 RepID=A0A2S0URU2_9RHOB|nr:hypothetical protein HYN69_18190 [Gemmobacter aquarius]
MGRNPADLSVDRAKHDLRLGCTHRGRFGCRLPLFLIPDVALTFDTLAIILPCSVAIAVVGLLECLMTQI